jgi:Flp pilus assembly protein TadD
MALARLNKTLESIEDFKKALQLAPGCGLLANWIADAYFDLGDLENAIEFYGQATRLNRMDSNAHNDLADAYRLSGKIDLAIQHYNLTIELDPFDTNAILEKAQCLLLQNKEKQACETLINLIEKFPKTRDAGTATILAGNIFVGKKDYQTAIQYFQKALVFFPYNTSVLFQAGLAYMVNGDKPEAEQCFKKIVELDPSDEKVKKLLQEIRK